MPFIRTCNWAFHSVTGGNLRLPGFTLLRPGFGTGTGHRPKLLAVGWRFPPLVMHNQRCRRHDLSNILKLQAAFLYSIYHQRVCKTSLFHMSGVDFMHCNTCCTFKQTKTVSSGYSGFLHQKTDFIIISIFTALI